MLFATAQLLRAVHRLRRPQQGRQGAHRRRGCRQGRGHQDRRRSHRDEVHRPAAAPSAPRAGWRSRPTPSWVRRCSRSSRAALRCCGPAATLPLGQSTTPYQIYDAFFDVTKAAPGWNIDTVKQSLHVLSQTIDQTYPHLSAALDGVAKFSDTIGKRDEEIKHLLAQANKVASILGDRSEQIDRLLVNANDTAGRVQRARPGHRRAAGQRRRVLRTGAEPDQRQPEPEPRAGAAAHGQRHPGASARTIWPTVLTERRQVPAVAERGHRLGPVLQGGPAQPAARTRSLQPWVDAAFKKRGIDPENFWRSAGLPAFRFPDPNGTRFPNGAPPPAPPVLEGTPDHPGPAVAPGSPCSYTPHSQTACLPRPGNPLPCAGATRQGPFGADRASRRRSTC